MKRISVLIPTYNEEDNVEPLSKAIVEQLECFPRYDYEIVFIDNDSQDNTRNIIRALNQNNPKIKAVFNAKNFGPNNSTVYGMLQVTGDCAIVMAADFQEPVEMIPKMIEQWEKGYKIVSCIKTTSKENQIIRFFRSCYYRLIKRFSEVEQIEHYTGFGLYDASFLEVLRNLNDPTPFLRGLVAELGFKRISIPYEQQLRRAGYSKFNSFFKLYDVAMLSFTSYTKVGLRLATFFGAFIAFVSFVVAVFYLVYKLVHWNAFEVGTAPMVVGMFFLGGVQLIFLGLIGEYILSINKRVMNRPLVVELERIGFESESDNEKEKV